MQINGFPVERKKLEELTKAPYNPRKISPEMASALKRSLQEFGNVEPIIWNKQTGHIVGGHQRFDALLSIGETETDVVIVDMPEEREQALNIALNKISGDWDNGMLSDVLLSLHEELRELTGFSEDEIAALLPKHEGLTDPDAIPEAVEPVARLGDIWQLGEHRLMCGDSTDAGSVALLMNGDLCDMVFTSPPYLQQRDYTKESQSHTQDWDSLMNGVFGSMLLSDNAQLFVNLGLVHKENRWIPYWTKWIDYMDLSLGFRPFGWYIWDQCNGLPGDWNGRFAPSFEFVFHFNKSSARPNKIVETKEESRKSKGKSRQTVGFNKTGGSKEIYSPDKLGQDFKIPDSVIRIPRNSSGGKLHPATFPVSFPEFVIQCFCGDVYEPFCGSGTTLIACEKLNRKCYGMEISPQYCDVIIKRWEDFTGKKAVKIA